jgi:hypothetical protein
MDLNQPERGLKLDLMDIGYRAANPSPACAGIFADALPCLLMVAVRHE